MQIARVCGVVSKTYEVYGDFATGAWSTGAVFKVRDDAVIFESFLSVDGFKSCELEIGKQRSRQWVVQRFLSDAVMKLCCMFLETLVPQSGGDMLVQPLHVPGIWTNGEVQDSTGSQTCLGLAALASF